jgi:hypothetical protein
MKVLLLVLAMTVIVVGMWVTVNALLSYSSGWAKLAAVYCAERPPSGRCFPIQGAKIGDVFARGPLSIYTSHVPFPLAHLPFPRAATVRSLE